MSLRGFSERSLKKENKANMFEMKKGLQKVLSCCVVLDWIRGLCVSHPARRRGWSWPSLSRPWCLMGQGERAAAGRGARTKRYMCQAYMCSSITQVELVKNKTTLAFVLSLFLSICLSYQTQTDSKIPWSVLLDGGTLPPGWRRTQIMRWRETCWR